MNTPPVHFYIVDDHYVTTRVRISAVSWGDEDEPEKCPNMVRFLIDHTIG